MKETEVVKSKHSPRQFVYNLNDKATKTKLIKGSKRQPFEVKENTSSCNLIFNLGAWANVVIPSIKYWEEVQGTSLFRIDNDTVRVVEVKAGKDNEGKQTDSLITFMLNTDKVVLHCYHTTQLILFNGNGYKRLVDILLKPFFELKIKQNYEYINQFNENALNILKSTTRANVRFSTNQVHLMCQECDFISKTKSSMTRHRKLEHTDVSVKSSQALITLPRHQSTRNNSLTETAVMTDNITINSFQEEEILKFTCLQCDYVATSKALIDEHVSCVHSFLVSKTTEFVCGNCPYEFDNSSDFKVHLKSHHTQNHKLEAVNIVDVHQTDSNQSLNHSTNVHVSTVQSTMSNQCPFCDLSSKDLESLREHIEILHAYSGHRCSECNLTGSKSEIMTHMRNKHSQEKINSGIKCKYCNNVFENENLLKEHESKVHEKRLLF